MTSKEPDTFEQCIICGTIFDEENRDDIVSINHGNLCIGCFQEGWFKQCKKCGKYEFEDACHCCEENDTYICHDCYTKGKQL